MHHGHSSLCPAAATPFSSGPAPDIAERVNSPVPPPILRTPCPCPPLQGTHAGAALCLSPVDPLEYAGRSVSAPPSLPALPGWAPGRWAREHPPPIGDGGRGTAETPTRYYGLPCERIPA